LVLSTWLGYRRLFLVLEITGAAAAFVRLPLISIVEGGLIIVFGAALDVIKVDLFLSYIIADEVLFEVY
jgi:fructose-specific component phosphotransferase system IIB-like protein